MRNQRKNHSILKVILVILMLVFITLGCERELGESSPLIESAEQSEALSVVDAANAEDEELGVIVERNVPVPMRDGTILHADVCRPDRGGPYPVLVHRTPYGKGRSFAKFVRAGYIVVNQDVRGRHESDGRWVSLFRLQTQEAKDGYDTVEWAARLSGSNSKVGTLGTSYPALLQWCLAPLRPPSLVVMSASSNPARIWDLSPSAIRPGSRLWWWAAMALDMRRKENIPGVHTGWEHSLLWYRQGESKKWLHWLPWSELPQDFFVYEAHTVKSWLADPHADPWRFDEGCKDIAVPNLDIVGWYDQYNGGMSLFLAMARDAATETARKGSKLIIGPWSHAGLGSGPSRVGRFDFGPDAAFDIMSAKLRWFDYWLKGKQNGVDKEAPVRIFVMGDNKWRDEQSWPLERSKEKIFYITSGGHANTPAGDGRLVVEKMASRSLDKYIYDSNNPVPTLSTEPMPVDQRPLANRQDILVYQTEPLEDRIEVTGYPVVELYASSSAPDTDWFARLIDVAPDGLTRNVSSGMVRARYRNGFDRPKLIEPNEVVKYTIPMRPTSNAFLAGHRIRLDITSSDFPNYDRNHNTAANQNTHATLATARQKIYHGGEQSTRIILPWVQNAIENEESIEEEAKPEQKQQIYPLHQAVADGDIERINMLLSENIDINIQDQNNSTPLCHAAKSGRTEIVQLLVEAGADVNAGKWPPLCVAVEENNVVIAKYLIGQGANVNAPEGWTALQEAPYIDDNIEMAKLLIVNGADVNAGPWTALHTAASKGREDIARLLIQEGANVNARDKGGRTPLYYSLREKDRSMTRLLISNGAEIQVDIPEGLTLLHHYSIYDSPDIVEKLLAEGAKVDEQDDNYKFTALHYAARFGSKDVAEVLIASGADTRAKDKWDYQPIHWAAYHDRPEIIELLIAKGADVNVKTSLGQTPLELAVPRRNTSAIEVLKKHGARE